MQTIQIQDDTVHALETAISLNRDLHLALLYLCHNAYDLGNYAVALQHANRVRAEKLPPYMRTKWAEIRVCCHIRQRGLENSLDHIRWFVEFAGAFPKEDIVPFNLFNALTASVATLDAESTSAIETLLCELDRISGQAGWFLGVLRGGDN